MPVTRGKGSIPKGRHHWSMFYDTPEWKEAIAELERGLAPQEYICIGLSDATIAELPSRDAYSGFYVTLKRHAQKRGFNVDVLYRSGFEGKLKIYCVGR